MLAGVGTGGQLWGRSGHGTADGGPALAFEDGTSPVGGGLLVVGAVLGGSVDTAVGRRGVGVAGVVAGLHALSKRRGDGSAGEDGRGNGGGKLHCGG